MPGNFMEMVDELDLLPPNWPLSPRDPCEPGWLAAQVLVRRRTAGELACALGTTREHVQGMLARLRITRYLP